MQEWHSAYAGRSLSKEEVVQEMTLLAVCREYVFDVLGAQRPSIAVCANGLSLKQDTLNIVHFTPLPDALASFAVTEFPVLLSTGRGDYGIRGNSDHLIPPTLPSGEKLGRMLMYFRGLRELAQICAARRCWPQDRMLVLHGVQSPYTSPTEMMAALTSAGILYLVILCAWNEEQVRGQQQVDPKTAHDILGTGCFCSIPVEKAINIALDLNKGDRSSTAKVFRLEHDYRENAWASNHPLLCQASEPTPSSAPATPRVAKAAPAPELAPKANDTFIDPLGYYSTVRQHLASQMPDQTTIAAVRDLIHPTKGSGVFLHDIKGTGLANFLEMHAQTDIVTKEEVLAATWEFGAVDIAWLKGVQSLNSDAVLCIESRHPWECKTLSAAVILDPSSDTTTVIVNVTLEGLKSWPVSAISTQMHVTEERPRLPQLIVHGTEMNQFNTVAEAHLQLVSSDNGAKFIRFPWNPDQFDILQRTRRWIFWSLPDETAKLKTYYWGYGDFGSTDAFDEYVASLTPQLTGQPQPATPFPLEPQQII